LGGVGLDLAESLDRRRVRMNDHALEFITRIHVGDFKLFIDSYHSPGDMIETWRRLPTLLYLEFNESREFLQNMHHPRAQFDGSRLALVLNVEK
jgi:hypothetical protein